MKIIQETNLSEFEQGMNNTFILLKDTSKNYKSGNEIIHAVDHVNLTIQKGEFVVIMGPSGSGKSTLLNLIAGLTDLTDGEIYVNKKAIHNSSEDEKARIRRSEIGIVFQFYNLHDGLTALENVELPMLISNVPLKERRIRAKDLLKTVELDQREFHRPYEMSGGEKQRVGIARALANNANIILADEPTGDLDFENGRKILDLLIELNKTRGVTIVMVTHDSTLIHKGFRLIRLKDGKIIFDELIENPDLVQDDFSPIVSAD